MKKTEIRYLIVITILLVVKIVYSYIFSDAVSTPACRDCNVLIVTFDSLRQDHLGVYGYHRQTSANIDALANESMIFARFIANSPSTYISMPSMISSRMPEKISSVSSPGNKLSLFLLNNEITLPSLLRKKGYATSFYCANPALFYTNFSKDFDTSFYTKGESVSDDMLITKKTIEFITHRKDGKFFAWIHFISPHAPYLPGYPFNETFAEDEFYHQYENVRVKEIDHDASGADSLIDPDAYIAQYDGEIKFADNEFSKLIISLKELDLYNNTIIIVSSDHGESMTEHGNYFEHGVLYEDNLWIPLIIFNPRDKNSKRIEDTFEGLDLAPIILRLVGIDQENDLKKRRGISPYSTGLSHKTIISLNGEDYISYRFDSWKLIIRDNNLELFDLEKDPMELSNLIDRYDTLKIQIWLAKKIKDSINEGNMITEVEYNQPEKELLEQLRSLGYIE